MLGMEISSQNGSLHGNEEKALKGLLDAFGTIFSLEEIASAYCKADQNADMAREILSNMQGSTSTSSTAASDGEVRDEKASKSSYVETSENPSRANGKSRASKQKWCPVSVGTVSSVLGKDYITSKPIQQANGSSMTAKPLKLDCNDFPVSELWGEEAKLNLSKNDHLQKEMEDFLFKMLGDGFQLGRDFIKEVLENCGYDMEKSMNKLLDQSATDFDRRDKVNHNSAEKISNMYPNSGGPLSGTKSHNMNSSEFEEIHRQEKERKDLQKELLVALFTAPDRTEESPRKPVRTVRRSTPYGELVTEPFRDASSERKAVAIRPQLELKDDDDEEGEYHALRKAVKENRGTMKEYYKAAIEAFAKGDHDRANILLEQGNSFFEKARQADEESNQKIFETNKSPDTEDAMLLNLHDHGAKEAIRLLKCHLSSLAGIPSINYLKVVIEKNEEDSSKGARRRLIMRLLEKESIKWTEEGNPGTILIRLDNINPQHLRFAKK